MAQPDPLPEHIDYGPEESQFGELWLPVAEPEADGVGADDLGAAGSGAGLVSGDVSVVVLIHGGFWRSMYGLELMTPLARDLVARGYAVWNIEYRRVGEAGGGFPGTLLDVATAVDSLASLRGAPLDIGRVVVVGHSAGGHLAMWVAGRAGLGADAPGSMPVVEPVLVVSQAGVVNLDAAAADRYSNGATQDFLGGEPFDVPDRYAIAQPNFDAATARLMAVHGTADQSVPIAQSHFAQAYGAEFYPLEGVGHMELIDPHHQAWHTVLAQLPPPTPLAKLRD